MRKWKEKSSSDLQGKRKKLPRNKKRSKKHKMVFLDFPWRTVKSTHLVEVEAVAASFAVAGALAVASSGALVASYVGGEWVGGLACRESKIDSENLMKKMFWKFQLVRSLMESFFGQQKIANSFLMNSF